MQTEGANYLDYGVGLKELTVTAENTPEEVAENITINLREDNATLVLKIVLTLGNQKAIDFYNRTMAIEREGGITTVDGSRRKTPGGVFFRVVSKSDSIARHVLKDIFLDSSQEKQVKKNQEIKERRRKKNDEIKEQLMKEGLLSASPPSDVEQVSSS